jgi:hypothetical protein
MRKRCRFDAEVDAMAGFRSLARQVRDPRRLPAQRRTDLRRCLERFAPYGHRATWHHLCARAGFGPQEREPEAARLIAALDELEEARADWLAYEQRFAARRRAEKWAGVRQPPALDDWHRRTWGGNGVARCDDPLVHPDGRLADVLRRLIDAMERGPRDRCPVCAGEQLRWPSPPSEDAESGPVCGSCGIVVPLPLMSPGAHAEARSPRLEALAAGGR